MSAETRLHDNFDFNGFIISPRLLNTRSTVALDASRHADCLQCRIVEFVQFMSMEMPKCHVVACRVIVAHCINAMELQYCGYKYKYFTHKYQYKLVS